MKKSRKSLMLLPLIAICLSGCYTIIPEDAPEVNEEEFIPEGSYILPDENLDSDPDTPDEPSETHNYTYSLQITNKEELASLTLDENVSSENTYTLSINLISYDNDIVISTEAASEDDVIVTSSSEDVLKVDGLTLIPQVGGGETTISATWLNHSEATDSFSVTLEYIPYTPTESYDYKLVIENKEDLGSTWKITDTRQEVDHTLIVVLYEYKYLDGDLAEGYPFTSEASLSDIDIAFTDDSVLGVSTDSISFYPIGLGSTEITLTWKEHIEAYDSFSVIVEEVSYEYNYILSIDNADDFSHTDDENVWRVGDSHKTLSVSLTSTTYLGSTDTSIDSTIAGDATNVSVSISPIDESPEDGLTSWGLNLMASAPGSYTITASWIGHQEATQSITVLVKEKTSTTYTMSVSSEDISNIENAWYLEDEVSRSFKIDIEADDGDPVDLPFSDSDIVLLYSLSELQIDYEVSNGQITITPIDITTNVEVTLFIYWSLHTEAHITLTLSLNQHAYEISITNEADLSLDWSVEDGARTVEIETKKDGEEYSQDPYVVLLAGSLDSDSISISGLNIKPLSEGKPTVTAVWYKYDPDDPTYESSNIVYAVSNTVQLSIDENIKPVSISLSKDSITLNAYYDTDTLSAKVLGINGDEATEQGVTWSVDNTGIVLTDGDANSITVSVTGYNIEGTITCTSAKDPTVSATCSLKIGDQPNPNGPQDGDTTYKLGCKKSDGTYVFFDGGTSSSHLTITEDWEQAVDVYVSPNEYEMGGNGCTLSFYSGNTLEYLASSESTSSKGNMKLSTTPYRWVWDSYNGYSFFSAPAFEDRYIGLSGSDDFRTYAQSSLSSDAPVYPYAEIPEDYTYGTEEEPDPELGGDEQEEGLLGKLDFSLSTDSSGNSVSTSDIDACWSSDSSKYSGCQTASTIYIGNSSGSGDVSGSGFIRASSSGTNGEIVLKFVLGVDVDKVVINAQAWSSSESSKISVNGSATQSVNVGSYSELTYELSGDYVNTVTIDFTKRSFVNSIKIYGTYDDSVSPIESLSLSAEKTTLDIGDEVDISVSWTPYDTPYDVDDLTWESSDSNVASVSKTSTGATVSAVGQGDATITATDPTTGVNASLDFTVNGLKSGDEFDVTITYKDIMNHEVYADKTWGSSQTVISSANGTTTDFLGCSITWYTGSSSSNGCSIYNAADLRIYPGASFDMSALEGYEITGAVLTFTKSISNYSVTNASYSHSSGVVTITNPTGTPITFKNTASSSNTITFSDSAIVIHLKVS